MDFRRDVNGLRAIAVLAVLVFHFKSDWMPGGFAGVDVFFVISGFLMTGVILRAIEKDSFSVWKFYLARAIRIVPAMLFMIAMMLIFCFFLYTPIEYREMSIYSLVSLLFLSNIYYWKSTSYFNPDVDSNIFVHTWSLSAEWQFYMLYPLLLMVLCKLLSSDRVKVLIVALSIIGFVFNVWFSMRYPDGSYYLLPSRIWEMLIGGCAFFVSHQVLNNKAVKIGSFALIVASFFIVSKEDYWPGYMALLPVVSAFVFIASGDISSVFKNRVAEYVGLRSYSIYLWHWPIFVLLNKYMSDSLPVLAGGVVLTVLASEYSFRRIEVKVSPLKLFVAVVVVSVASFGIYRSNGYNFKSYINVQASEYLMRYDGYREAVADRYGVVNGLEATAGEDSVFLWGDSHAESLVYGFNEFFKEKGVAFSSSSFGNCIAGIGIGQNVKKEGSEDYKGCLASNEYAFEYITAKAPKVVVFVQRDGHDSNDFQKIINAIANPGIHYMIVGPVPQWKGGGPLKVAYELLEGDDPYADAVVPHLFGVDARAKSKFKASNDFRYVSVLDHLCTEDQRCIAYVDEDKNALHWDNSHLSLEGSKYLVDELLGEEVLSIFNADR